MEGTIIFPLHRWGKWGSESKYIGSPDQASSHQAVTTRVAIEQDRWSGWGVGDLQGSQRQLQPTAYQLNPATATAAKSLHSCPTLCDPIDGSPPGSAVPWILQARTLEWAAISFSNAWKRKVKVKSFSHVRLLATPWTAAYQAPPSMGFSRQEYWSGVPSFSPVEAGYLRQIW